jgi:replicative DNA helicase
MDPVVRNDAAQRIADAFQLEFETVWSRVRGKGPAPSSPAERRLSAPPSSAEKFVLTAALQGKLTVDQLARLQEEWFEEPACKTLFHIMKSRLQAREPIDFGEVGAHLKGESEVALLAELSLTEDIDDSSLQRIDENLLPMERSAIDRRLKQIQREIVEAGRSGDTARETQLLAEKTELRRIYRELK